MKQQKMTNDKFYLENERKIINLMLRFPDVVDELVKRNIRSGFFLPKHQNIVQAIYYVYNNSKGKRLLTNDAFRQYLLEVQNAKGELAAFMKNYHACRFGIGPYNVRDNLDMYIRELNSAFLHRASVSALEAFNDDVPNHGYEGACRRQVSNIQAALDLIEVGNGECLHAVQQVRQRWLERKRFERDNPAWRILTGYACLDKSLGKGLKPGQITTFVGGPGDGKTNFMANIAINIWKQGKSILYVHLEMDDEDMIDRLLALETGIPYSDILSAHLTDQELDMLAKQELLSTDRFHLQSSTSLMNARKIENAIRKIAAEQRPDVVIIDYLSLMTTNEPLRQDMHVVLGKLLKECISLAKGLDVHIITACQLNRRNSSAICNARC